MVFSSTIFLFIFLPLTLILYFNPFCKKRTYRNTVLLLVSLGFYAWGEPIFVFIMIFSIIINWLLGLNINKNKKIAKTGRIFLVLSLIWNVGLLFVFKYLSFIVKNLQSAFPNASIPSINIALPIGISFFTFQIMSYIFDVYYEKVPVQKNIFDLALYISLFPQLIAGPIVRYETVENEIRNRHENSEDMTKGIKRFVYGLAKKCLLANYVAVIADLIWGSDLTTLSMADSWIGAIAYTLQIYFDFSGYSDMAIGLGLMLGFHFEENFNYPYIAKSITDFWHRWHISLSTWFRDYVYIPLGGNRCSKIRWIFNLFIVWALTGIWHGANWTFWLWGIFYFVLLLIEKLTGFTKHLKFFSHIYSMFFVIIGWVLFRALSLPDAWLYLKAMFGINGGGELIGNYYIVNGGVIFAIALIFAFPVVPFVKKKWGKLAKDKVVLLNIGYIISSLCMLGLFVLSLLVCIKSTYNPFIYFNF